MSKGVADIILNTGVYQLQFQLNDIVYLKTDGDNKKRMVTSITLRENGITYELSQGDTESWHGFREISDEVTL